jgi:hypothetical protein
LIYGPETKQTADLVYNTEELKADFCPDRQTTGYSAWVYSELNILPWNNAYIANPSRAYSKLGVMSSYATNWISHPGKVQAGSADWIVSKLDILQRICRAS